MSETVDTVIHAALHEAADVAAVATLKVVLDEIDRRMEAIERQPTTARSVDRLALLFGLRAWVVRQKHVVAP